MYGRNTKSNAASGAGKGRKDTSPIRVVVKCAWSGTRLTVPCDPPIRSSTTLLDLVQRLQPELPPSLFLSSGNDGSATLVCLRKLVPQSQWVATTLGSILDGDDGAAGVVLTLDLGGAGGGWRSSSDAAVVNSISAAPTTMTMARAAGPIIPIDNAISSAASSLNIKPAALSVICLAPALTDEPTGSPSFRPSALPTIDPSTSPSLSQRPVVVTPLSGFPSLKPTLSYLDGRTEISTPNDDDEDFDEEFPLPGTLVILEGNSAKISWPSFTDAVGCTVLHLILYNLWS